MTRTATGFVLMSASIALASSLGGLHQEKGGNACDCPHPGGQRHCEYRKLVSGASWNDTKVGSPFFGSAADKLDQAWARITEDTSSEGYMNPLKTLLYARDKEYISQMGDRQPDIDMREPGHKKITHGLGGHAKAHFEWLPNHRYTGLFKQADSCLIRVANAGEPSKSFLNPTSWNPNMAVKCFRDGTNVDSANMQVIWEIDGYNVLPKGLKDSCSFFEVPLSNHCGRRDDVSMPLKDLFITSFQQVSSQPLMLGTSQMAMASQNSVPVANPVFPFAIIFVPNPELNQEECDFNDAIEQLRNVNANFDKQKPLYDVYAVPEPWTSRPFDAPEMEKIGILYLDSDFTPSKWGDTELFFQHTFFESEMEILKSTAGQEAYDKWNAYASKWYKAEGANWYIPYIPK